MHNRESFFVDELVERIDRLIGIGIALSAEKDLTKLLESILMSAEQLMHSGGGTIYTVGEDKTLRFDMYQRTSV
jgi:hypothetical protein